MRVLTSLSVDLLLDNLDTIQPTKKSLFLHVIVDLGDVVGECLTETQVLV